MKKLFLMTLFLLSFCSLTFAQVEEPPAIQLTKAEDPVIVEYDKLSPGEILIKISGDGFLPSSIGLVSNINLPKQEIDELTGFTKKDVIAQRPLWSGTFLAASQQFGKAVQAGTLTQAEVDEFNQMAIEEYVRLANLFNKFFALLEKSGSPIDKTAIKVVR
jgi:hypothetical protein